MNVKLELLNWNCDFEIKESPDWYGIKAGLLAAL